MEDKKLKFLFKYPTMGRPDWFCETLGTYYKLLSGKHDYQFLVSLNEDDPTMLSADIIRHMMTQDNLIFRTGLHKSKVQAINADMDEVDDFDILVLVSDDMIPQQAGFDLIIAEDMLTHFPEMDGALHYNDGCCGQDKCITLSIMGKKMYDHFGYIYHPDYRSLFCDNEFTDVVRDMNKVRYFPSVIIKHDWKGGRGGDHVYKRNGALWKQDQATYNRRKELNFPVR